MIDALATVKELAYGLRRRQFSSVELTRTYLDRLKTIGDQHRVVAELTEQAALRQARAADDRLANRPEPHLLCGIPYGAKDLLAVEGIPTRWGSPGHDDQVFDFDATVIAKLNKTGAVLAAKLAMIELAGGGDYMTPAASATGPCLSAWDKRLWAGGSSSGSGAAAALGLVGFTLGSETSGSITCPSAFNGATGFRPTYGRVSRHGAMALCWTLDKIGPIARSADCCATVLEAISGRDERDPSSLTARLDLRARGPKPRVGLLQEDFEKNKAPDCQKAYESAVTVFREQGYETVDVAYPEMPYGLAVGIIVDAEGASAHEQFIRSDRLYQLADPNQIGTLAATLETRAVDYLWALRMRTEALKANAVWDKCDCIFTPVFYHKAPPADKTFHTTWVNMGGDAGPANLLGWPSMAFPIGFEDGAPLGGQIIAPAFREDIALRAARDFQRETDFHRRRPPNA